MWTAVFTMSFLVFVVAIGGTLVMAIKRNPVWKKWLATIGASFVIMVIGAVQIPPVDSPSTKVSPTVAVTQPQSQGLVATPVERPTPTPTTPETNNSANQLTAVAAPETKAPQPSSASIQTPAPSANSSPTSTVQSSTTKTTQPSITTKTVSPTPTTSNQNMTVYVGATGTKYHYQTCRTLKDTRIPMSINEAKSQGYTACGVCKPPQ